MQLHVLPLICQFLLLLLLCIQTRGRAAKQHVEHQYSGGSTVVRQQAKGRVRRAEGMCKHTRQESGKLVGQKPSLASK